MPYVPEEQKKKQVEKWAPYWTDLLLKNGVPANKIQLVLSQIIHESGWFTSAAYLLDKNPGGITWNPKYKNRPGASIGRKRPANETGNYVKFDSYDSAAKDYVRIINMDLGHGKPVDSTNYVQYADILKKNKYYTEKQKDYTGGLKAAFTRLDKWFSFENIKKKKRIAILLVAGILFGVFLKIKK